MLPFQSQIRNRLLPYIYYALFGIIAVFGLMTFIAWKTGGLAVIQPRVYDAPLSANASLCFFLLGLVPLALGLDWKRTAATIGLIATLFAGATLLQDLLDFDLGIDDLFVRHAAVLGGANAARMPIALSFLLTVGALLLTWVAARPSAPSRPLLLALFGSLSGAYGLTSLVGYRTGLNEVEFWQAHAQLGPPAALALVALGAALVLVAARETPGWLGAGPRWMWVPMVVCCATVTATFWVALRHREIVFINSTTQLTSDNVAALFHGESEAQVANLARLAQRWGRETEPSRTDWENEVAGYLGDFEGYRSIQWIDASRRTRWYWPPQGNEDASTLDHGANPLRRAALDAAQQTRRFALAAPLDSPPHPPSFAIYLPLQRDGRLLGFVAGEITYPGVFLTIERRLKLARRYTLTVTVQRPDAPPLEVYRSADTQEKSDRGLRLATAYEVSGQRLGIALEPRAEFLASNRQYLPEIALFSGLGLSLLLGLVVNLAQSALRRERVAAETSEELLKENEERRRVEERLKTADERLALAFESTQVGVYEWDLETDEVYCTPSIWKITGYDPAAMPKTGQGWLDLLHPEDRPAVRAAIDAHVRGETPFIEIEHCVLHHSGEWFWIALRAKCTSFTAARQPRRILGTMQNINARKKADEALRASQAVSRKLSLVASKTDNAVVITDHRGLIEWANESYARLTGRRLGDISGTPLVSHLAGSDSNPTALVRLNEALGAHEPITTDLVQMAVGERRFHVHLDVQPVFNDEGAVENFIAIATDITARVETEQQLRRAKADADTASRAKSEFLAAMSHEIRTPMNAVIGMTSLLLETQLSVEQRDYVTTIRSSGDTLLSIINEILDFSKIESGKMELESQPFEITQCVEEAIDIFAGPAGAKNIELAYTIDPAVPSCVLGDITRLRQILINLMSNAVKFTAKGFVTIEVAVASNVPAPSSDDRIVLDFYVTDTGIGIPAERLGQLFQPFSQLDGSTTRRYGGTGLGLAICDRLCQLMGGGIEVHSTPGEGSRFHFSIQAPPVIVTDGSTPPMFGRLPFEGSVLAVDDHPVNRTTLNRCLNRWKLQPLIAADAAEARRMAASAGPALVAAIVDQDLGGTSGLELAAALRLNHPRLPIILLTPANFEPKPGENNDPLVVRLRKPIKPYPLHDTLRLLISRPATPSTPPVVSAPPIAPPPAHASISPVVPTPAVSTTPAVATMAPAVAAASLAAEIPLELLLVEDNPVNQKVALRYLDRLGYRARAVANGREAVQAVSEKKYDLVFMDVQMPEMDGFTATREIRAKFPPERQPVIVALTANAMQGDREKCLDAGMNDYVTKPVKSEEIVAAILRHFGTRSNVN